MGYAVNVPRNADRINKTENQHDPERDAREKVKHAEEVGAVHNARRDGNGVPPRVRENPGIRLRTLDGYGFTRRSRHCVQEPFLEYTRLLCKSSRKLIATCILEPPQPDITLQKGQAGRR